MYLKEYILQQQAAEPGNNNHVVIYDRSQSMYWTLPKLGEDMKRMFGLLKKGDTLTLAWFSTEGGTFRTILKGFVIGDDLSPVNSVIDANIRPVGLTCFSEVLQDTEISVEEVKAAFPGHATSMVFLTDGHPVVSNQTKERQNILLSLSRLREKMDSALFIGYGDYYNRHLLTIMADEIGGALVHADELLDVTTNMEGFMQDGGAPKVVIDVEPDVVAWGTSTGKVVPYPVFDKKVAVPATEAAVYTAPSSIKPGDTDTSDWEDGAIFAMAYLAARDGRLDDAIDWLSKAGDKFLIDNLSSAFSLSEIGNAVDAIQDAATHPSLRYVAGKKPGYGPDPNTFCLLDALEVLQGDEEGFFYPTHPDFKYKRIGVGSKTREGYPEFVKAPNVAASFSGITMHQERLNMSIRVVIPGTVDLGDASVPLGLPRAINTYQWRNYALIADGNLNVTKLPVSMSRLSFTTLQGGGLIPKTWEWEENKVYTLDLRRIPIINRSIADTFVADLVTLADRVSQEADLLADMKVLKWLRDKIAPEIESTPFTDQFNDAQLHFLLDVKGFRKDGSFSPPVDKEDVVDFYEAPTFKMYPVGWTSLPPVQKVVDKATVTDKELKGPEVRMWDSYSIYKDDGLDGLDEAIEGTKRELMWIRSYIQRAKFSVLLAKRWFEGADRAGFTMDLPNDVTIKFVPGVTKVSF